MDITEACEKGGVSLCISIDDDRSGSEFHEPTCFNYVYTILFHYIILSLISSLRLYLTIYVV